MLEAPASSVFIAHGGRYRAGFRSSTKGRGMDYATKLALRAIISGLHYGGTIDQRQVQAIVDALAEAAIKADGDNRDTDAARLRQLRDDIARDGQVSA